MRSFTHPQLQYLANADFGTLPTDLSYLDVSESEIAKMTLDELVDAVEWLDEFGYDHTTPWHKVYGQYRNDAFLASRGLVRNQSSESKQMPAKSSESKQMPAKSSESKQMPAKVTKNQAKELFVAAAQDERVLDIIDSMVMDEDGILTGRVGDLVYAVQEYIAIPSKETKAQLFKTAKASKLKAPTTFCEKVQASPEFQTLLGKYLSKTDSSTPQVIVATGTTAEAIAQQSLSKADSSASNTPQVPPKPAKAPKAPAKPKSERPLPTIATLDELESMDRKALMNAMGALNDNRKTNVRANAATAVLKETLALHVLGLVGYKAPTKAKASSSGPKTPKAPKAKKEEPVLDLPEGLSWASVRDMKYRQLQALGKVFRSRNHAMPGLNSKGDDIRKAIADAMRTEGYDIAEVTLKSEGPAKDLHLPNLAAARESQKLDRIATEALKIDKAGDTTSAQAHLQMAVAA